MHIFFITTKLNFSTSGGSVEEFDLMIRTLIDLGNEVTVITAFSDANDISSTLPYKLIEEQICSVRLVGIQAGILKILRKYQKEADFFHIDGHIFLYGAGLYRFLGGHVPVSAFFNRELSCWSNNVSTLFYLENKNLFISLKEKLRFLIEKFIFVPLTRNIDIFIFTNPVLKQAYYHFGMRFPENRTLVMGDPIDYQGIREKNNIDIFTYSQRNLKDKNFITIFYSSRMVAGKGFDLLIKAFSLIRDKKRLRLILGGDGPESPYIRKMTQDLGLEDFVVFPGWVSKEKVLSYYKEADIFVQARWRTELTSVSLSYALAFGVPSIVPARGGLAWVVGRSALCFEDGDYHDLARKIGQLVSDFELRNELSINCSRRIFEEEMNHVWQINRWNNLMNKIVKDRDLV